MGEGEGWVKKFIHWMAPNPLWDLVKWLGGSSMTLAILRFIDQEIHRNPVDWAFFVLLLIVGAVLVVLATSQQRKTSVPEQVEQNNKSTYPETAVPDGPELLRLRETLQQEREACAEEKREYANRCLEYRTQLSRYAFSTLQMELIDLARDLRNLLSENPRPFSNPGAATTSEQIVNDVNWCDSLFHQYRDGFARRVQAVQDSIGKSDPAFARYLTRFVNNTYMQQDTIEELIKTLWGMAVNIEVPKYEIRI